MPCRFFFDFGVDMDANNDGVERDSFARLGNGVDSGDMGLDRRAGVRKSGFSSPFFLRQIAHVHVLEHTGQRNVASTTNPAGISLEKLRSTSVR